MVVFGSNIRVFAVRVGVFIETIVGVYGARARVDDRYAKIIPGGVNARRARRRVPFPFEIGGGKSTALDVRNGMATARLNYNGAETSDGTVIIA